MEALSAGQLILIISAAFYLLIGFVYAVWVVVGQGGGIFSIPINTLLGPVYLPIGIYLSRKAFFKKHAAPKQEASS